MKFACWIFTSVYVCSLALLGLLGCEYRYVYVERDRERDTRLVCVCCVPVFHIWPLPCFDDLQSNGTPSFSSSSSSFPLPSLSLHTQLQILLLSISFLTGVSNLSVCLLFTVCRIVRLRDLSSMQIGRWSPHFSVWNKNTHFRTVMVSNIVTLFLDSVSTSSPLKKASF